ncbi:MAG: hypothetical protein M1816_002042 [Peltula sp. TS41687]|nr:MAG: hypothetical protein M1816_002042 [Peltula sp. TS41687]
MSIRTSDVPSTDNTMERNNHTNAFPNGDERIFETKEAGHPKSEMMDIETFRALTGMPPVAVGARGSRPGFWKAFRMVSGLSAFQEDLESNIGLWRRICQEEVQTAVKYSTYNSIVVVSLIGQLVLSAVLIVLGALPHDYHIAIAVLGSVNGVITGILALLKNQGLPERFQRYQEAIRDVRKDAERVARKLESGKVEVKAEEVTALFEKFDRAQHDNQSNRPDVWFSTANAQGSSSSEKQPGSTGRSTPTH